MSVGGAGIPRLQDLRYVTAAARAVSLGKDFEQIRRAIIDQAELSAGATDYEGTIDPGRWTGFRDDPLSYVHNTVDVLKELMRLGWLERHVLPSSRKSAYAHARSTFELTEAGRTWTELVSHDELAGYNRLVGALLDAHPQFDGFLRRVGARPGGHTNHL